MKISDLTIEDCFNICLEANKKPCIECPIQALCGGFFKDFPYNLDDVMDDDIDYEPGKPLVNQGYKKLLDEMYEKCITYARLGSHSISVIVRCSITDADKLISDLSKFGIKATAEMFISDKLLFRFTW